MPKFRRLKYLFFGILNTNISQTNANISLQMPNFGVLNTKNVLWNSLKVKRHFWHLKCQRLVFMKLTPGHKNMQKKAQTKICKFYLDALTVFQS